jgi:hypothetical protein
MERRSVTTAYDDLLGADLDIDTRSEKAIQNDALVRLSAHPDSLYWRQNTGQAWQGQRLRLKVGQTFRVEHQMVILRSARPVSFGLEGSGDIMGAEQGVPVAVEMKDRDGQQRKSQEIFERCWTKAGGIYVLARTAAEASNGVRRALQAGKT